jgi:predicted Fe-Mo cluster-binding NifX family protein
MKIGIPVWEGKVSPVLDTACRLKVLEVEGEKEVDRFEIYLEEQAITRKCVKIHLLGIDILICGAISRRFYDLLTGSGINVIPWICGLEKDVLDAYMKGDLLHSGFFMPGCSRKKGDWDQDTQKE